MVEIKNNDRQGLINNLAEKALGEIDSSNTGEWERCLSMLWAALKSDCDEDEQNQVQLLVNQFKNRYRGRREGKPVFDTDPVGLMIFQDRLMQILKEKKYLGKEIDDELYGVDDD